MSEHKDEPIDLNKLTQRELLILCTRDVQETKAEVKELKKELEDLRLKVNTLETKSKVQGGVVGFFSGLLSGVIGSLISRP